MTGTKCPSKRDVRVKGVKISKENHRPTLDVCFTEVSVRRESVNLVGQEYFSFFKPSTSNYVHLN